MILKQLIKYDNAPVIEATWADENGVIVKCRAYGVAEFDELVADLGADAAAHEALIAEVEATYVPPVPVPEPVPASCTRRQGRLALLQAGKLDDVESTITAITDSLQRRAAQIEYEADTWERSNTFLQGMWNQLGGTPEELDDLFRLAVTL